MRREYERTLVVFIVFKVLALAHTLGITLTNAQLICGQALALQHLATRRLTAPFTTRYTDNQDYRPNQIFS